MSAGKTFPSFLQLYLYDRVDWAFLKWLDPFLIEIKEDLSEISSFGPLKFLKESKTHKQYIVPLEFVRVAIWLQSSWGRWRKVQHFYYTSIYYICFSLCCSYRGWVVTHEASIQISAPPKDFLHDLEPLDISIPSVNQNDDASSPQQFVLPI